MQYIECLRLAVWDAAAKAWVEATAAPGTDTSCPPREKVPMQPWEVPEVSEITVVQGDALVPGDALGPVTGEALSAAADDLIAQLTRLGPDVQTARRLMTAGGLLSNRGAIQGGVGGPALDPENSPSGPGGAGVQMTGGALMNYAGGVINDLQRRSADISAVKSPKRQ